MRTSENLSRDLAEAADVDRAAILQRFFKTGAGEYGAGDRFLGIAVPVQRRIALRYRDLALAEIGRLLQSPIHEERFCALEILVWRYEHAETTAQEEIFHFYLENTAGINNWDLVDTSAPYIVGEHLMGRSRKILRELARSDNVWRRRIAIVATLGMVKHGELDAAFRIARLLRRDRHSLIHKAVGWVLRETGKVSEAKLLAFLTENYAHLPRTTLRYAIERFPPERRKKMLAGCF